MNETLEYLKTKYRLDYTKLSPIEIVGVGRMDLIRWIRELDFKIGAEIGVDRGNFSKLMLDLNPQLKLYGIDPWLKYDEYREYIDQADLDSVYEQMQARLQNEIKTKDFVPIRKMSMDALEDFKDESLDFVYIDANHEGNYPYEDISGWAKKVRPGGIIAGHDYVRVRVLHFTIKDALDRYTVEQNIKPWFILGRYAHKPKEIRDRTRSWMFVKS